MDRVIENIYTAIRTREHLSSTLFVLCGDHGMNDAGNHGASSPGETSPALVFISPKLESVTHNRQSPLPFQEEFEYYTRVEQSDLAPTLGALLGFPTPQNNLGAFIADFLPLWPKGAHKISSVILKFTHQSQGAIKFNSFCATLARSSRSSRLHSAIHLLSPTCRSRTAPIPSTTASA